MSETSERKSMTYGVLPSYEEFDEAFWRECPNGRYDIRLGTSDSSACDGLKLGDGEWECKALWDAIQEIVDLDGDTITVSEDGEYEDVYQVFYPGTDRPYVEIGPDPEELCEWAKKFSKYPEDINKPIRARECLHYTSAYGGTGKDYARKDAAMDLVSSILDTLGFEWV